DQAPSRDAAARPGPSWVVQYRLVHFPQLGEFERGVVTHEDYEMAIERRWDREISARWFTLKAQRRIDRARDVCVRPAVEHAGELHPRKRAADDVVRDAVYPRSTGSHEVEVQRRG